MLYGSFTLSQTTHAWDQRVNGPQRKCHHCSASKCRLIDVLWQTMTVRRIFVFPLTSKTWKAFVFGELHPDSLTRRSHWCLCPYTPILLVRTQRAHQSPITFQYVSQSMLLYSIFYLTLFMELCRRVTDIFWAVWQSRGSWTENRSWNWIATWFWICGICWSRKRWHG